MKKWIISILGLVAVAALAAWWFLPKTDKNAGQQPTAKVEVRTIEQIVTATGSIEPRDYVDVGAQVSGQLEVLHVKVGDIVEAGQLLAEIDATVLAARLDGVTSAILGQ